MEKNGLPFGMGRFESNGQAFAVTDFMVFNDGIVAVAEKTEWAELFLEDITRWVTAEFGFREPVSGIRKAYGSTLVVDFDTQLSSLFASYSAIATLISSHTVKIAANGQPMQFSRMDFEVDNTNRSQLAVPKFILERRAGVKFAQERFFSVAPMHTADHVKVLAQIEKLAAGSRQ